MLKFPKVYSKVWELKKHRFLKPISIIWLYLSNQQQIENLKPNFPALAKVKARGVIATAPGRDIDFVSRCFYPQSGVNEDPVTGSAHTIMVPYWAKELNKNNLRALQLIKKARFFRM